MAPIQSVDPAAHEHQLVARVGGFRKVAAIEALALVLLLLRAPVASAETFTNVFFFGASGEDTGIFTPTHADAQLGLGLVSSYGYDPDRWTNAGGTVWAEPFAAALGHSATSRAYGGTNYAIGGGGGGTAAQIAQFSADHGGVADPGALYYIFGGGEMLDGASPSLAVSEMLSRINQLSALGATHFLIPNFPDYGPFAPGAGPLGPYRPIPANASESATAYATELSAALSTLSGVTIYQLDLKGLLDPLFADPVGHGFSAGLTLCVEVPDCRAGIGVDEYVMFDHLHPTSATHDLWAQAALAIVPAACSNGIDEDGDGRIDFGSDPGCASSDDPNERSAKQCDNGVDDDNDGKIDWRGDGTGDPHCVSLTDNNEATPPPPFGGCGLGPELVLLLAPMMWVYRRRGR